jgi:pyridoxine/pyridoxamine 5'-phosphate oxidase
LVAEKLKLGLDLSVFVAALLSKKGAQLSSLSQHSAVFWPPKHRQVYVTTIPSSNLTRYFVTKHMESFIDALLKEMKRNLEALQFL